MAGLGVIVSRVNAGGGGGIGTWAGGVAFDDLLADGIADGILETIFNYKLQLPDVPSRGQLALRWRIEGVNGVVDEITWKAIGQS